MTTETESNNGISLQLSRWLLRPMGAWPSLPSSSRFERSVSVVLIVICYSLMFITIVPSFLHVTLEDESLVAKMKTLGPLIHWCIGCVNYTTLILRRKDIYYYIDHIETDWRTLTGYKEREVMLRNAKLGRYVAVFYGLFMQCGMMCFCVLTAITSEEVRVGNESRIVYPFPCPIYENLIDIYSNPTHEILIGVQLTSALIVNSSAVGIFSLVAALAAHACGQLSIIMDWITEFVNEFKTPGDARTFKEMGMIVERHLRALNFISYMEETISPICFLELFRFIMATCVLGFYTFTEWAAGDHQKIMIYFLVIVAVGFNAFVMCYIGELIADQCEKVGEVVYMTDWYYLHEKRIADLIMIITRSSIVVHITAFKLAYMSIYTFSNVLKSAFAYLNLLLHAS